MDAYCIGWDLSESRSMVFREAVASFQCFEFQEVQKACKLFLHQLQELLMRTDNSWYLVLCKPKSKGNWFSFVKKTWCFGYVLSPVKLTFYQLAYPVPQTVTDEFSRILSLFGFLFCLGFFYNHVSFETTLFWLEFFARWILFPLTVFAKLEKLYFVTYIGYSIHRRNWKSASLEILRSRCLQSG